MRRLTESLAHGTWLLLLTASAYGSESPQNRVLAPSDVPQPFRTSPVEPRPFLGSGVVPSEALLRIGPSNFPEVATKEGGRVMIAQAKRSPEQSLQEEKKPSLGQRIISNMRKAEERLHDLKGRPLIDYLNKLAKAPSPTEEDLTTFSMGFATACEQAEPSHDPLLVELFTSLPVELKEYPSSALSLANLVLRREIERLSSESIKVSFPPEEPLSDSMTAYLGPQKAAAVSQYLSAQAPFATLKTTAAILRKRSKYHTEKGSYWKKADALLSGAPIKAEEFLAFDHEHSCMMIEPLTGAPKLFVTIALIREQRFTEAVGAALEINDVSWRPLIPRKFLSLCGFAPEALIEGARAARENAPYLKRKPDLMP
jgi:hypothetical protein